MVKAVHMLHAGEGGWAMLKQCWLFERITLKYLKDSRSCSDFYLAALGTVPSFLAEVFSRLRVRIVQCVKRVFSGSVGTLSGAVDKTVTLCFTATFWICFAVHIIPVQKACVY